MATEIRVQNRVVSVVDGVSVVSYQDAMPAQDCCNWKGKGGTPLGKTGTESEVFMIVDTAEVTMWYRPDLSEQDRIFLNNDLSKPYTIINVENIEQRNMHLILKVIYVLVQMLQTATVTPCTGYGRRAPEYGDPYTTQCHIYQPAGSTEIIGYFPPGTPIKVSDRIECEGIPYLVMHAPEDHISNTPHVEVSLRELRD